MYATTKLVLSIALLGAVLIPPLLLIEAPHPGGSPPSSGATPPDVARGREIWLNNTYGNEKYFTFLMNNPDPARRVPFAFEEVLLTPRRARFKEWGLTNDPDCKANPAGGFDICPDEHATGVVGLRQFKAPDGSRMYGITCASCHIGFDPLNPPEDVTEPKWENLHLTIGNQYGKFGKVFSARMDASDPRRFMFGAWVDGTVDTTLLFNDHILNPGVVTAFWAQPKRANTYVGLPEEQIRNAQGGEDDLGGQIGAIRVYTNIGVCFQACVAPRPDRPDPAAPIDVEQCRRDCADFPPEQDMDDLVAFMRSVEPPKFPGKVTNPQQYQRGFEVFKVECAGCHTVTDEGREVLSDDVVIPLVRDPENTTNRCRALTTNWETGHIWQPFSSDNYKSRVAAGLKGYRDMPLTGIWATAPLLHTQTIGKWAPPAAPPALRAKMWEDAMWELMSPIRRPIVYRLPQRVGQFPAGTPLTLVYSRDPVTGKVLCSDVIENRGHHYGAELSRQDKAAIIAWLKYQ